MSTRAGSGRIDVHNTLIEGLSTDESLPTVILNTLSTSLSQIQSVAATVSRLQMIAPAFRVVLLTDLPAFGVTRPLGWPVEHVMPSEHRFRIAGEASHRRYVAERIRIIREHYRAPILVRADDPYTAARQIANLIGHPDLAVTAQKLAEPVTPTVSDNADWGNALAQLVETGHAEFDAAEGHVRLHHQGPPEGSVLITGTTSQHVTPHEVQRPSWAGSIIAEFNQNCSCAFEAYSYCVLAKRLGRVLSVVTPWRVQSLLSEDTMHWVDLGLERATVGFHIHPAYAEAYRLLSGSDLLDWEAARRYAAARRISRSLTNRRAAR